jgi:hypothetical protein
MPSISVKLQGKLLGPFQMVSEEIKQQFQQAVTHLGISSGDTFFRTSKGSMYKIPASQPMSTQRFKSTFIANRNNQPQLSGMFDSTFYLDEQQLKTVAPFISSPELVAKGKARYKIVHLTEHKRMGSPFPEDTPVLGVLDRGVEPPVWREIITPETQPELGRVPLQLHSEKRPDGQFTNKTHLGHPITDIWPVTVQSVS